MAELVSGSADLLFDRCDAVEGVVDLLAKSDDVVHTTGENVEVFAKAAQIAPDVADVLFGGGVFLCSTTLR